MRDHQSYFAVEDKNGKLAPHFLAVLNIEADEAGLGVIRRRNQRRAESAVLTMRGSSGSSISGCRWWSR